MLWWLVLGPLRKNHIHFSAIVSYGSNLHHSDIGMYSYIGKFSMVESAKIGNYCSIGNNVQIGGCEHAYWDYSSSHHLSDLGIGGKLTTINHDVWIGSGAFIKQGVILGHGAVVAAGAVVIHDVPSFAIVAGVPAKLLKYRFPEEIKNQILATNYWNFPPKIARQILSKLASISVRVGRS